MNWKQKKQNKLKKRLHRWALSTIIYFKAGR
uniref:Uncharacterized protein n=1 Tax=Salmonella phage vB_SEnST11_KE22 TaxID=3161173 RepID=A0AAU8GI31_9CAUD